MKSATAIETIEIAALNIGMHIHLDGGWMSHPFPRSSFRISSLDQIATLVSLGLERVRWSPQDSDFSPTTGRWDTASLLAVAESERDEPSWSDATQSSMPVTAPADAAAPKPRPAAPSSTPSAAEVERTAQREALRAQRQSLAACEQQF
ncbi:MAG: DUF3391 domain-containing protein, partial [Pseudomonadota bacterium]|nr:DUF3391 domain-containing protein [Pseudomonadota bacterium]